jgi:predicted transcriptional regulator
MLIVETIGRIRREHFIQGKTIREIARDLKLSRNTVRKVLRSAETAFSYGRQVQPRPKLGRWTEDLDRLLARNADAPARERMTLIRIFEELRALAGGYDAVRRFARAGAKRIRVRRRAPSSRWPSRRARPASSTGAMRSSF